MYVCMYINSPQSVRQRVFNLLCDMNKLLVFALLSCLVVAAVAKKSSKGTSTSANRNFIIHLPPYSGRGTQTYYFKCDVTSKGQKCESVKSPNQKSSKHRWGKHWGRTRGNFIEINWNFLFFIHCTSSREARIKSFSTEKVVLAAFELETSKKSERMIAQRLLVCLNLFTKQIRNGHN